MNRGRKLINMVLENKDAINSTSSCENLTKLHNVDQRNFQHARFFEAQCNLDSNTILNNPDIIASTNTHNSETNETNTLNVIDQEELQIQGSLNILEGYNDDVDFSPSDSDSDYIPPSQIRHCYVPETSSDECDLSDMETIPISSPPERNHNEAITISTSPAKGRKRKRQIHKWKRNILKEKVNKGKIHRSVKKTIPAKCVKGSCSDICKLKCKEKICSEAQIQINKRFWELGDPSKRRNFIVSHTKKVCPRYRRVSENKTRSNNYAYYLTWQDGIMIKVCKQFFMNSLCIGDTFIRKTLKKLDSSTGILEEEKRGKHGKQKGLPEIIKNTMREHISSFPCVESHYTRANTTRKFLDGSLSISEMYRMYVAQQNAKEEAVGKKCIYAKIFNEEYNLSFFSPKKDQCAECASFKNMKDEDKEKYGEKYKTHQEEKELSRKEKAKDVSRAKSAENNITVACYDLQAVLTAPCGEISVFYYKRKLNCFNFTVFEMGAKIGHCYFWNESIARRGSNEISSCVHEFIKSCTPGHALIFYSDNCVGQQKNKGMVAMYLQAVQNMNVPSITHKFLIAGHTQNEGDSMHSCIERQKKRVLKSGPIYIPEQWIPVLRMAKKDSKPFIVNEMATSNFNNYMALAQSMGSNYNVNQDSDKVLWHEIVVLKVSKEHPFQFFYKTSYSDQNFKLVDIRRRKRGRPQELILQPAYTSPPGIAAAKISDLKSLCTTNVIPKIYHSFFNAIPESHSYDSE